MNLKKTVAMAFIGASVFALASSSAAYGEGLPSTSTILVGSGSDTTQDVMNQIANTINLANGATTANKCTTPDTSALGAGDVAAPGKTTGVGNLGLLCNWDALTPSAAATISTRDGDADCQNVTRPNGSGQGIRALADSISGLADFGSANLQDCFDYARASGLSAQAGSVQNTMRAYQYAVDQVEPIKRAGGSAPNTINRTGAVSLARLYSYDYDTLPAAQGGLGLTPANLVPGSAACLNVRALVPQSGSGTLSFWASAMQQAARDSGATTAAIDATKFGVAGGWSPCVDPAYTPQENTGSALRSGADVIPHSCGQYYSQRSGVISPNQTGIAVPVAVNQTFCGQSNYVTQLTRNVYNVIREDHRTDAVNGTSVTVDQVFGPGGLVCSDTADILKFGLSAVSGCGNSGLNGTANAAGTAFGWASSNPQF